MTNLEVDKPKEGKPEVCDKKILAQNFEKGKGMLDINYYVL